MYLGQPNALAHSSVRMRAYLKTLSNFYNCVECLTFAFKLHALDNSGVVAHSHEYI